MIFNSQVNRRRFIKTAAASGVGLMLSERVAPLYSQRGSPSDTVRVAVMGLNGRGAVHAKTYAGLTNVEVAYVCDVDKTVLAKCLNDMSSTNSKSVKAIADFRRALDDKNVDAISIAAPDHWHAPAALLAMQAGKHVYVEKPCGHNVREGEMLVSMQEKTGKVVQMGTQQRSHDRSRDVIDAIHGGAIGNVYQARAWYANTRVGIGRGKAVAVPANLDYELWQGPAPRVPYRDNLIHYNWHWFKHWGTGEICNNGTHEIDIGRWALGVNYPTSVTSTGGRFHFADDWEFPDTQEALFEFDGGKSIVWQGQSCNGALTQGRQRGTIILGTTGSVVMDRNGYSIYDLKNRVVKESIGAKTDSMNTSADDVATTVHMQNFIDAVRTGAKLHAPIAEGAKSVLLCHLGNIAQQTGRKLKVDANTGRVLDDADAVKMCKREYAPGWMAGA